MTANRTAGVTCILNAAAGSSDMAAIPAELERLFAAQGSAVRIRMAPTGGDILAYAREAADSFHIVVAGGGDGTINAVAGALAGTDAVLGVLPLGTLNHFAKDLKIPLDLPGAVATILDGRVARVDVGEVNGQIFLNNSSLGAYPQLVRERQAEQGRGHAKWLARLIALVATLRHPALPHVRLQLDGGEALERRTPLLFVGNNRYSMAGSRIGARDRLDAGRLWLCMAPEAGRSRLMRLAVRALTGRLRAEEIEAREVAEFWVKTRRHRIDVARDGEVTAMAPPLHYRIRPGALLVMAPPDGSAPPARLEAGAG